MTTLADPFSRSFVCTPSTPAIPNSPASKIFLKTYPLSSTSNELNASIIFVPDMLKLVRVVCD